MQYIIAWLLCVSMTLAHVLTDDVDWKWLAISDINVTVWLGVAYMIGKCRKTTTVKIIKLKDAA